MLPLRKWNLSHMHHLVECYLNIYIAVKLGITHWRSPPAVSAHSTKCLSGSMIEWLVHCMVALHMQRE